MRTNPLRLVEEEELDLSDLKGDDHTSKDQDALVRGRDDEHRCVKS